MFTQDDLKRMYEQAAGGQQQRLHIPEDKIALFVERCYKEKGYCRETLLQQIDYILNHAPVLSGGYAVVLPLVREYLLEKR